MLFWIVAVACAALVAVIVALPLLRRADRAAPRAAHDAQVFRDQLKELDNELARGAVSQDDADATRLELSRRLLAADDELKSGIGAAPAPKTASLALAAFVVIGAPAATLWLYTDIGMPGAEDLPFAARVEESRPSQEEAEKMMAGRQMPPPAGADVEEFETLVTQLEARLEQRPDDAQGVFLYARSLMNLARFADAWPQFQRVVELRGGDAEVYAGLSEAMILAAGGYISPEAEDNLLQVLKFDPSNPSARYYLGHLHRQNGDEAIAGAIWTALINESPPDAPWVAPIRQELASLGQNAPGLAGPTQAEMDAAANIPPAEQNEMVQQMVENLATRLAEQGGTVQEWQMLIRSYNQLGDARMARQAMEDAREAFAGDVRALSQLTGEATAPLPGPSQDDMAAAAEMPAGDRAEMIRGMVERLAGRLASEGGTLDEWLRLISSYGVLGDTASATGAYQAARDAFADDPTALATLESAFEGAPRTVVEAPTRGPTQEDMAAAADMAPEDRQVMIRGMVARLHERLSENGRVEDVNEWGKLMRSYGVLGDVDAVRAAYEEAIAIYDDDAIGLAYLKESALLNGVTFE